MKIEKEDIEVKLDLHVGNATSSSNKKSQRAYPKEFRVHGEDSDTHSQIYGLTT